MLPLGLHRYQACMCYTDIHVGKTSDITICFTHAHVILIATLLLKVRMFLGALLFLMSSYAACGLSWNFSVLRSLQTKELLRPLRETLGGWSRFLLSMTISRILFLSQIKLLLTFIYRLLSEQTFLFLWNEYPGMWLLCHMFECVCDFIEAVKLIPEQVHRFTFPPQHQEFLFLFTVPRWMLG